MVKDWKAEFEARGGKVSRVAEGASNGMSAKDWYKAERGIVAKANDMPRIVAQDHLGRNWYANAEGEIIAHD